MSGPKNFRRWVVDPPLYIYNIYTIFYIVGYIKMHSHHMFKKKDECITEIWNAIKESD